MAAVEAAARLTEQHRLAQARLGAQTVRAVRAVWPLLDPNDLDRNLDRWLRIVGPLITRQRVASTALAADYVRVFRSVELGTLAPFAATRADPAPAEQVITSLVVTGPARVKRAIGRGLRVDQAMSLGEAASAVSAMRHVLNGGRETVIRSVEDDARALGWARATSGSPCGFCAMLASRGPVYRGQGSGDFKPHDACSCSAEPVYRENAPWPGAAQDFRRVWDETSERIAAEGGTTRDVVKAFRATVDAH